MSTITDERTSTAGERPIHVDNYKTFISSFVKSRGSLQILIVSTIYAIGIGSVLGLVRPSLYLSHVQLMYYNFMKTNIYYDTDSTNLDRSLRADTPWVY
jgi:hypothetical protein